VESTTTPAESRKDRSAARRRHRKCCRRSATCPRHRALKRWMASDSPHEPALARRVVAPAKDHLLSTIAAERPGGRGPQPATGPPDTVPPKGRNLEREGPSQPRAHAPDHPALAGSGPRSGLSESDSVPECSRIARGGDCRRLGSIGWRPAAESYTYWNSNALPGFDGLIGPIRRSRSHIRSGETSIRSRTGPARWRHSRKTPQQQSDADLAGIAPTQGMLSAIRQEDAEDVGFLGRRLVGWRCEGAAHNWR